MIKKRKNKKSKRKRVRYNITRKKLNNIAYKLGINYTSYKNKKSLLRRINYIQKGGNINTLCHGNEPLTSKIPITTDAVSFCVPHFDDSMGEPSSIDLVDEPHLHPYVRYKNRWKDGHFYYVPGYLIDRKTGSTYIYHKRLGEGIDGIVIMYCKVQLFQQVNKNECVALKILESEKYNEYNRYEDLTRHSHAQRNNNCNVIPLQQIFCEKDCKPTCIDLNQEYFLMWGMIGDLYGAISVQDDVNLNLSIDLFNRINKYLLCLTVTGLFYPDIKTPQIIYECTSDKNYEIYLGDISSITKYGNYAASTYPNPIYTSRYGYAPGTVKSERKSQDWALGMLALSLRGYEFQSEIDEKYMWDKIQNKLKKTKTIENMIEDIRNLVDKAYPIDASAASKETNEIVKNLFYE